MNEKDRKILRELASRVAELAESERMEKLNKEWTAHNGLRGERPMILVSPERSWLEILPEKNLECEDDVCRSFEKDLRMNLVWGNVFKDDTPVTGNFPVPFVTERSGFVDGALQSLESTGEEGGAYHINKLLSDVNDLSPLSFRKVTVDRQESDCRLDLAREAFGDILNVRRRGSHWWTMGLTWDAIRLIGLEDLMVFMYTEPEALHSLMAWLRDDMDQLMTQYEELGLIRLNNEDDGIASGGFGWSDELPGPGYEADGPARLSDLWGFGESQETVGISPEMFGEFIFPYQKPLLERFGLNCYGCCEPVESRWEWVKTIPRLRRLSVSPWSDLEMARDCYGKDYIYSRKPNPAPFCVGFEEEALREDLKRTMALAKEINLEVIMKDTHTCEHHPERFVRWVEMARDAAGRA